MRSFKAFSVFAVILSLFGCKKSRIVEGAQEVLPTNLTPCAGNSCNFSYTEWSDLKDAFSFPVWGKFRIFKIETARNGIVSSIWIKSPMEGIAFKLSSEEIRNGKVIYTKGCPVCMPLPQILASGSVRGNRIARSNMTEPETWILEADMILQDSAGSFKEKIYTKQIFYPDFIRPEKYESSR